MSDQIFQRTHFPNLQEGWHRLACWDGVGVLVKRNMPVQLRWAKGAGRLPASRRIENAVSDLTGYAVRFEDDWHYKSARYEVCELEILNPIVVRDQASGDVHGLPADTRAILLVSGQRLRRQRARRARGLYGFETDILGIQLAEFEVEDNNVDLPYDEELSVFLGDLQEGDFVLVASDDEGIDPDDRRWWVSEILRSDRRLKKPRRQSRPQG